MNLKPAESTAEMVKRRLKLLSDFQSAVDKMCTSVPNGMKLVFDVEPTSLEISPPEPSTPGFGNLLTWLTDQIRYVSSELAPIGDHDMDQRRLALLRRLKSEIDCLERMKETAWARVLTSHIIQSHMSSTDQSGPLSFERGMLKLDHSTV